MRATERRRGSPRERIDAGTHTDNLSDDLMSGNDGGACVRQFAIDDVQIGSTDAAGVDLHNELPRSGTWIGHAQEFKRLVRGLEHHRVHHAIRLEQASMRTVQHSCARAIADVRLHELHARRRRARRAGHRHVLLTDDLIAMSTRPITIRRNRSSGPTLIAGLLNAVADHPASINCN